MARTQMVTIPLEEYKELLLRDRPSDHDKELAERLLSILGESLEYTDEKMSSWNDVVGPHMQLVGSKSAIKEMLNMLRYVDPERYMGLFNKVMTAERERKANEERINHMNEAKELRAQIAEEQE